MEEKKQKNREKEKLEHDLYQQLQLVDKLKAIDKSTLASIVNSLRHQRNNPQLTVDLDQLHSTLLQEAREQIYRYEQLGLGRKKGQGIAPIRPPINHHTSLHQQQQQQQQSQQLEQQQQQQQQPKSMDNDLPFTYETLLPLTTSKNNTIITENNVINKDTAMTTATTDINHTESIEVDVDVDVDVKENEENEKEKAVVFDKELSISSSLPITSKENSTITTTSLLSSTSSTTTTTTTSSSFISTPTTIQTDHHDNDKTISTANTTTQLDLTKGKKLIRSRSSSSSSSSKDTTSKDIEDKKLRDEKVLNYFKSRGSLAAVKGHRRSMRTITVFGDKVPFFDTVDFSLPLDQFGDLMEKRKRS